jgi:hypothetical protein
LFSGKKQTGKPALETKSRGVHWFGSFQSKTGVESSKTRDRTIDAMPRSVPVI